MGARISGCVSGFDSLFGCRGKGGEGKRCSRFYCPRLSKVLFYIVNTIVFLVGMGLLIATTVLGIQSGDLIAGLSSVGLIGPAVAGGILILVSFLGCLGVSCKSKILLVVYFLIMFVMSVFVIAAGTVLLFFVDDVNNVNGAGSEDFIDQVEGQINDYIVAVFNTCCAGPQGLTPIPGCNTNPPPGSACFSFIDTYQDALDRIAASQVCVVLENTNIEIGGNVVPIVGDVGDGGCAGGDGDLFVAEFSNAVQDIIEPLGGAVLGIGVILLLNSFSAVCIFCANRETFEDDNGGYSRSNRNDAKDFERGIAPRPKNKIRKQPNNPFDDDENINAVNNPRYNNYY